MLVLSRHRDESIIIGENIKVKVIGVRGRQVRIGIEAPKEVSVFRQELLDDESLTEEMLLEAEEV